MKILFFANTEWYLYNFRLPLARHLRDHGHEVVMLSPPGPYVARLQAAGFRALTVPMQRRSLNPLRELTLFHPIRQIYARERPDLAHHFTLKCVVYGGLAARLTGVAARPPTLTRTRFEPPRRCAPPLLIQGERTVYRWVLGQGEKPDCVMND